MKSMKVWMKNRLWNLNIAAARRTLAGRLSRGGPPGTPGGQPVGGSLVPCFLCISVSSPILHNWYWYVLEPRNWALWPGNMPRHSLKHRGWSRCTKTSSFRHEFDPKVRLSPKTWKRKEKGKRDTILIKCNKNACKRIAKKVKNHQIKCKNTCHHSYCH